MFGTRSAARAGLVMGLVMAVGWLVKLFVRVSCRYVSGLPLDGQRTTDATFTDDGTQSIGRPAFWGRREPTRWALWAGWKRAAVRLGVPLAVYATHAAWARWPSATRGTLTVAAGAALGWLAFRVIDTIRTWHHMNRYVRPLHVALSARLPIDEKWKPLDWLHVPLGFRQPDAVIHIRLPETFHAGVEGEATRRATVGERQLVDSVVFEKLGLSADDMLATYEMVGRDPMVTYTHVPRVPVLVTVDMVREAIEDASESTPVIGQGRDGVIVAVDLDAEAPHTLLSMGTGGGKSMLLRGQIAQHLANGAHVVILDVKRTSLRMFRDHPNVRYLRDVADIHDELLALTGEIDRRTRLTDDAIAPDEEDANPREHTQRLRALVGPRLVVVLEEANTAVKRLDRHWKKIRSNSEPKVSPAIDALEEISCMGREPGMNMYSVSQLSTVQAMGGSAVRENFANRVLGRSSAQAWKMLAPDVMMPKKSTHRGRVHVIVGDQMHETQVVKWTVKEARELAWSCFENGVPTSASQLPREVFYQGGQHVTVSDVTTPEREDAEASKRENVTRGHLSLLPNPEPDEAHEPPASDPADELVTLKEAADRRLVFASADDRDKVLYRLRAARRRDAKFPAHVDSEGAGGGQRFRAGDLQQWERNRPKVSAS